MYAGVLVFAELVVVLVFACFFCNAKAAAVLAAVIAVPSEVPSNAMWSRNFTTWLKASIKRLTLIKSWIAPQIRSERFLLSKGRNTMAYPDGTSSIDSAYKQMIKYANIE